MCKSPHQRNTNSNDTKNTYTTNNKCKNSRDITQNTEKSNWGNNYQSKLKAAPEFDLINEEIKKKEFLMLWKALL